MQPPRRGELARVPAATRAIRPRGRVLPSSVACNRKGARCIPRNWRIRDERALRREELEASRRPRSSRVARESWRDRRALGGLAASQWRAHGSVHSSFPIITTIFFLAARRRNADRCSDGLRAISLSFAHWGGY